MESTYLIIGLMAIAILLVGAAQKLHISYPIALVLGGAILGFIPGLTFAAFDPNIMLVIVLPPILHYGSFWLSFAEMKRYWRDIFSLAFGLVVASTASVALLFKWLFPEYSWALAVAFGALVSPPDAIAATTILKRFAISPRLLTIFEGESLVNDAFALVLYRLAVIAIISGTFSWAEGSIEFIKTVIGGVSVGIFMGLTIQRLSSLVLTPVVGVLFSFIIPYLTYILADSLGVSGVLAVVVNGLFSSYWVVKNQAGLRRILGATSWDIFIILLNCFVFMIIGLQISTLAEQMSWHHLAIYFAYGLLFTGVLIAVRMIWVFTKHAIPYFSLQFNPKLLNYCSKIWREDAILGWSGMRGIISLIAVLALPFATPGRDIVIYLTFVIILLTLIIPGFTLAPLMRVLNIHYLPDSKLIEDHRHRLLKLAEEEIATFMELSEEERQFLLHYFKTRHRILESAISEEEEMQKLDIARKKVLQAQRRYLLKMWKDKEIDDKLLKILELELDLEETFSIRAAIT